MRKVFLLIFLAAAAISSDGQTKYFTKNGKVSFNASSPLEKIEASNEKAYSVFYDSSGAMEFAVLMKAFIFEKALMQDHFNENYVESDKFPKAVFKGTVVDYKTIDIRKDGTYPVKIKGTLTMHGETKDLTVDGSLIVKDGKLTSGKSQFKILLSDYKIEIPSVVKDKISNDVQILVDVNYDPYKAS